MTFKNNPHIANIDAISGTLFALRFQYEYAQTECDEGARDVIDIWYMGITNDPFSVIPCLCITLSSIMPNKFTPLYLVYFKPLLFAFRTRFIIKWGASSRGTFGPNPARGSI